MQLFQSSPVVHEIKTPALPEFKESGGPHKVEHSEPNVVGFVVHGSIHDENVMKKTDDGGWDQIFRVEIQEVEVQCHVLTEVTFDALYNIDERLHVFYRQLGCLAFSLRFWPKIKQLLSNCPSSD